MLLMLLILQLFWIFDKICYRNMPRLKSQQIGHFILAS